jgi:hypothetical protein
MKWSKVTQSVAGPPTHTPLKQTSAVVQTLPSSQEVLSGLLGLEQTPLAGLQVPTS